MWCSGSLISKTYVLTAAHCVKDKEPEDISIMAGAHERPGTKKVAEERQERQVKRIVSHPKFIGKFGDPDFAILELEKPFELTKAVKPVALATKDVTKDFDSAGFLYRQ